MIARALPAVVAAAFLVVPAAGADTGFGVAPIGLTDGQTVSGTVHIEAGTSGQSAARVEISIDGRLRTVATRSPFAYDWDTAQEQNGPHEIELWAVAADGTVVMSTLTLVVANTFQVALAGVTEGQQVTGTVQLAVQPSGLPAQWVEVLVDGELRWTLSKDPYTVSWNTALETAGPHTVSLWSVSVGGLIARLDVHVTVATGQTADQATLIAQTATYRAQTWALQSIMRVPRTASPPLQGTLAELVAWRSRADAARDRAAHPPHLDQWMCIHSHEASWTNHDTGRNGHYGGLQMSLDFMRGYGPELFAAKGTADTWTPLEQMWVAERAWAVRGFKPWPTTARMCGLL